MPEKKSTSTSDTGEKSIPEKGPGGSDLGRANYRAEQARDSVTLFAFGVHPTPGYIDFFEQSPIRIFPPEFIFRSIPPTGMQPQVLSPFSIWVMFGAAEPIKTVTVHDADGPHEVPVEQMAKTLAASMQQEQGTWVAGNVVQRGGPGFRATTMAVGEEGSGPTTMAVGEETIISPTTMAVGEETAMRSFAPTTMAVGEESPTPTTLAVGEEGATTQALGEEGPRPTTMAVGEEEPMMRSPFGGF